MAKIMFWNVSCYCGGKSLFNQFSWDTMGKFVDSSVYLFHHPSWTGPRRTVFHKAGTELRTAFLVYRDENDGISSFPAYLSSLRETLSGPQALFAFILFMLSTTLACDMKMFIMQGETQLKWILLLAWLQTGRSLACEQALLFGQAKRASRERVSEGPLPLAALPLARAFSRDSFHSPK